jgi:hypothetical protein
MYNFKPITGLFFLISIVALACGDRKPFVEHKLSLDNKNESCSALQPTFRMISNFGGERYEFEKCLPASYAKSSLTSERKGDTVLVRFNAASTDASQRVMVTLDIDSYPAYQYITIDDETYIVVKTNN